MFQFDFSVPFLENLILNGFGLMNYERNKDELSVIAEKIFDYKFKQKSRKIYEGANTKTILKYAEWEERCKTLLDTFFSIAGKNSGIILFPDIKVTLHSQVCDGEKWKRVMRTLNSWCRASISKIPTRTSSLKDDNSGLIIRNYDLRDHLNFRKVTKDEIKDTLGFNSSADMFQFQDSDERFLVFNPLLKLVLIIRLVELRKGDSKLLKKEIDYCIDELNLLCFLLKDELENTGVVVTGFLVYSGENAHSQSFCKDCDNIIFPFEIFNSVETFQKFYGRFFNQKKIEYFARSVSRNVKEDEADVFQAVASKILGYLSHLQFVMLQEPILPVPEQDPADNIKQAELLLNRYQMEIAYSDEKRIWLEGNYGTGKTVVALKKLELLLKTVKDEIIYYVNFARKSLLHLMVKQKFEKNENFRAIGGDYSLSNTIKHQILRKEREIGTKNIHLIVDEYNSQHLSTKEVENLIQILNNEEELKNSTVLIAVQPIKITRVDKFCENGIKRKFSETKHELHKLVTATGIKVKTLKNVMRTTVQINRLAEITRDYLDNKSNRCVRLQQYYDVRSSYEAVSDLDLDPKYSKETNFDSFQSTSLESDFSLSVTSDHSSNHTTSSPPFEPEKLIDYDEMFKLVHTDISTGEENYQETVTSYSFTCRSKIGHGIGSPLPRLIKFAKVTDPCEQVALIAAVLDEIIEPAKTKPNRIAVIHLERDDPPFWLKSLFQLKNISPSLKVTNNTEEFLKDTNKNLVLVKNLNCLRGLEFAKVLLILDSDEHHLRHLIPEAIARCMSNLAVLIRPSVQWIPKSETVADLVDEWEKHRLLRILKIGFCSKPSCNSKKVQPEAYCKDKESVVTYYGVHRKSNLFKDFLKEIKRKKIRNAQPECKDKQKEAEAE